MNLLRGAPSRAGWLGACVALVGLGACHEGGLISPGNSDLLSMPARDLAVAGDFAAVPIDMRDAPAADLAGFCNNPQSPRIELNGMLAASPAVSASILVLNCCDSAVLRFDSMQISTPVVLVWRHQVGQGPNPPVTLDLAKLPAGWSVSLFSDCDPTQPNCHPRDHWDTGFTGTLTVSGNGGAYQMSVCLTLAESAGNPHPVIHSLRLYTPTIATH